MASAQLTFDLPMRPALGRAAFSVSESNAQAVAMIDTWRSWPLGKLALIGPQGSGKSHLAQVWADQSGAQVIDARDVADAPLPDSPGTAWVIEDVPQIAGQRRAEEALFHLHNAVASTKGALLFTGATPPSRWPIALPDLASRLQAASLATLLPPDDALLAHVLIKLFQDRQIAPPAPMIAYLLLHMERSFAEAGRVVAEIDRRALADQRKIGRKLAAEVVADALG